MIVMVMGRNNDVDGDAADAPSLPHVSLLYSADEPPLAAAVVADAAGFVDDKILDVGADADAVVDKLVYNAAADAVYVVAVAAVVAGVVVEDDDD